MGGHRDKLAYVLTEAEAYIKRAAPQTVHRTATPMFQKDPATGLPIIPGVTGGTPKPKKKAKAKKPAKKKTKSKAKPVKKKVKAAKKKAKARKPAKKKAVSKVRPVQRPERLDMRLSKDEKRKLVVLAKRKKLKITEVVLMAIAKL